MKVNDLISKIKAKEVKVGVIGLGYVGLPLVIRLWEAGFQVIGFDTDQKKVEKLNKGESFIRHIPFPLLSSSSSRFTATTNMRMLSEADAIIICVPTPLTEKREPDMQYVKNTAQAISEILRIGQLIVLESTTYPGTTRELLLPLFESGGMKVGEDFYLVYSPEREDPGNPNYNTKTMPKIVGGLTPRCLEAGVCLYSSIVDTVVPVPSPEIAEATKLLENIYRAVNIALVNELKVLFDRMEIDIWKTIEAAKTKPFGFQPFYPGPGLGGHCIPIDPFYLTWKAREYNFSTRFIELAGQINTSMPYFVVQKIMEALNEEGKSLKNSKILILGVAYKKDVDDDRESPTYVIMDLLTQRGAKLSYNDPYIPHLKKTRKYNFELVSQELDEKLLGEVDLVLLVTDHSSYDYEWIFKHSQLVVDTRGAFKKTEGKLVRA